VTLARAALFLLALSLPLSAATAQTPAPRLKPPVPNHSILLSDADFTAFRRGMRAADDDDWDDVRAAIITLDNPVADHVLLWRIAVSDARAPFSDLDRAIDELEGWPRQASIRREAEWKIEDSGLSPALIVAWFEDREPVTGEGRIALGESLIALGRADEGAEQIRTAWRTQSLRLSNQRDVLREHGEILTAMRITPPASTFCFGPVSAPPPAASCRSSPPASAASRKRASALRAAPAAWMARFQLSLTR
jgi:soluble lytic murein transglycosylase